MSRLHADPSRLAPLPASFLTGLNALLDAVAPPLLDAAMTKATPRDDGVEVVLAHAETIAFSVWAQATRAAIVVGCSATHAEHARTDDALALIEGLLRGEREVRGYDGAPLRPDFGAGPRPR
jgi:hypothetical protein